MGIKVIVRDAETVEQALTRLKRLLKREAAHDQWRWRWWQVERYEKPSKRRRRKGWMMEPNA